MDLLGLHFDTQTHELSIPERKCKEIMVLLAGMLARVDLQQSVSWHELESMTGKLMWAETAVELGKAYLQQMRKPGIAVSDMLKTRLDRQLFCIPLYWFPRAVEELQWWLDVLKVCGGRLSWHVDDAGFFKAWRWNLAYGDREVCAPVRHGRQQVGLWRGVRVRVESQHVGCSSGSLDPGPRPMKGHR
eukprot:2614199-Rhodomonas_salina.2